MGQDGSLHDSPAGCDLWPAGSLAARRTRSLRLTQSHLPTPACAAICWKQGVQHLELGKIQDRRGNSWQVPTIQRTLGIRAEGLVNASTGHTP